MNDYYVPLGRYLRHLFPHDLFTIPDSSVLEKIWISPVKITEGDVNLEIHTKLLLESPLELQLPGVDGVSLSLGKADLNTEIELSGRLLPKLTLTIGPLPARAGFRSDLLIPVVRDPGNEADNVPNFKPKVGEPLSVELANIAFSFDLSGNVDIQFDSDIALPPAMIGETGVVVEAGKFIPVFSEGSANSLPETIPRGWRGIYLDDAAIYLPPDISVAIPSDIQLDDFFIGSGGFCGKATGHWTPQMSPDGTAFIGNGAGDIFGIPFALKQVAIEFKQNTLTGSMIKGAMILPFFDQPVMCEIALINDGGFTVAISADQALPPEVPTPRRTDDGLYVFTKEGLLELKLRSIAFEKSNDVFAIALGGDLKPLFGGYDWPEFQVDELRIDSNGKVSIGDAWVEFDPQKVFEPMQGVALEISKVGFGSEDDGARWIGFYAGLKLANPIPMSGSVEGLRVNWRGDKIWLSLEGAGVGFEVRDTVAFEGHLGLIDDGSGISGFRGGGKLTVIPAKLGIDAELIVANIQGDLAIYTYGCVQLPVGIPIGNTGAAFYGFCGLTAFHMGPAKDPDQAWWDDWYLKPNPGVGNSSKWRPERDNFALGSGATIGTASDNGYAVNVDAVFVLVVPGPVIMLEGVGAFLQDRVKPKPLRNLTLWDARSGQLLINSQGRYPLNPDDRIGKVIKATGTSEIFFDSSGDWHFFFGERDPINKRTRAGILQLFEGNSYLMIFPDRVAFGAWIGYDRRWKYGPLRVTLSAWMDTNAFVSWNPTQFKGDLTMVGDLGLRAFGFGTSLNLRTLIEAQGPNPYLIHAAIKAKLRTPRFLPNPKFRFKWEYEELVLPPMLNPLGTLGVEHLKVGEKWALTADGTEDGSPLVPLDGKIALSFGQHMHDAAMVGTNPSGIPPYQRVGDFEFDYRLVEVSLEKRSKFSASNAWETVATRSAEAPQTDKEKLWGVWLAADGLSGGSVPTPNAPMTKLLLFAESPFEYARDTSDDT